MLLHMRSSYANAFYHSMIMIVAFKQRKKLPVDAGPDGHCHRQSRPVPALSARPFESVVGTLAVLNMEFSVVLWRRSASRCGLCRK